MATASAVDEAGAYRLALKLHQAVLLKEIRRVRRALALACRIFGHERNLVLAGAVPAYAYCGRCGHVETLTGR